MQSISEQRLQALAGDTELLFEAVESAHLKLTEMQAALFLLRQKELELEGQKEALLRQVEEASEMIKEQKRTISLERQENAGLLTDLGTLKKHLDHAESKIQELEGQLARNPLERVMRSLGMRKPKGDKT